LETGSIIELALQIKRQKLLKKNLALEGK